MTADTVWIGESEAEKRSRSAMIPSHAIGNHHSQELAKLGLEDTVGDELSLL